MNNPQSITDFVDDVEKAIASSGFFFHSKTREAICRALTDEKVLELSSREQKRCVPYVAAAISALLELELESARKKSLTVLEGESTLPG